MGSRHDPARMPTGAPILLATGLMDCMPFTVSPKEGPVGKAASSPTPAPAAPGQQHRLVGQ